MLRLLRRIPLLRIPGAAAAAASRYMRVSPRKPYMNVLEFAVRVPPIPIFIAYNDYDNTLDVPAQAFEHMITQLPPTVESMRLPGSGHVFDWPNTYFFWTRMLAWLEEHF